MPDETAADAPPAAGPASAPAQIGSMSVAERAAFGKLRRRACPRKILAEWEPASRRADPVATLRDQEADRVPALVPIRYARMAASAFAFYRGSAAIMAADLGAAPSTGLVTQLCGDAHLANFGLFASPERSVIFDLNDFDETAPGPFEWDVARLATSFLLACQQNSFSPGKADDVTRQAAASYRTSMAAYADMNDLDIWYSRVDAGLVGTVARAKAGARAKSLIAEGVRAAMQRDRWSAVRKLTEPTADGRRFINDPPLLVPLNEASEWHEALELPIQRYRESLASDRQALLNRYQVIDLAHKVVGVGSVGLRAFVLLLQGRDVDDLLVLQAKEAVASVLEPYTGLAPDQPHHGERVVRGQRLMQAASDIFLGSSTGPRGRDYYIRQLRDMKWSPDTSTMSAAALKSMAATCGHTLARAHARAGDPVAIASYLGSSTAFEDALLAFSHRYADQVAGDYARFQQALASGQIVAATDESQAALASLFPLPASPASTGSPSASPAHP